MRGEFWHETGRMCTSTATNKPHGWWSNSIYYQPRHHYYMQPLTLTGSITSGIRHLNHNLIWLIAEIPRRTPKLWRIWFLNFLKGTLLLTGHWDIKTGVVVAHQIRVTRIKQNFWTFGRTNADQTYTISTRNNRICSPILNHVNKLVKILFYNKNKK